MTSKNNSVPVQILIVAGEASGESHAADLAEALRRSAPGESLQFFGCGGDRMRQAGVETLVDIRELAVLGPVEVVPHLWHLYTAMRCLLKAADSRRPRLAILVDFPDFNLRLARKLKTLRIPIIYFISPQVWAWRSRRVYLIKTLVDLMIVILPFEKKFYARFGMDVEYVGHPLVDQVAATTSREDFFRKHRLDPNIPTLSLLPGSRQKEVKFHLPILLETARRLMEQSPVQLLLPLASSLNRRLINRIREEEAPDLPLLVIETDTYNAVAHSDLAVVASGTATLEAALLGTPLIAVFRISTLTWIIGQYLVDVPFYCLVNLIVGRGLVPELYQKDFNADRLSQEVKRYLRDSALRNSVRMDLARFKTELGGDGASERAAQRIRDWMMPCHSNSVPPDRGPAV